MFTVFVLRENTFAMFLLPEHETRTQSLSSTQNELLMLLGKMPTRDVRTVRGWRKSDCADRT